MHLDHFYQFRNCRSRRISSWDRRGMNQDYIYMKPGQEAVLADIEGAGKINRFYCVIIDPTMLIYRKMVLRCFWDGESHPSVEVPLGDFFCVSHCMPRPIYSMLMTVNPGNGGKWCPVSFGLTSYFPMPFSKRALITLQHGGGEESFPLMFWYHLDYEESQEAMDVEGRFHAQWRRERVTTTSEKEHKNSTLWDGVNLDGHENYTILEAKGRGQLVGVHLQVDNIVGGWWGEGDDMIFVDGEKWPPSIHGTGTEEIFSGGACPSREYSGPYTGFHLVEHEDFSGKNGMYRWYVGDPIRFDSSIRMTIEHGHANNFENDYSSVAYWYQVEPHDAFPTLPAVRERLPRVPEVLFEIERRIGRILSFQERLRTLYSESDAFGLIWKFIGDGALAVNEKRYSDCLISFDSSIDFLEKLSR
jgi:hypothetical protein